MISFHASLSFNNRQDRSAAGFPASICQSFSLAQSREHVRLPYLWYGSHIDAHHAAWTHLFQGSGRNASASRAFRLWSRGIQACVCRLPLLYAGAGRKAQPWPPVSCTAFYAMIIASVKWPWLRSKKTGLSARKCFRETAPFCLYYNRTKIYRYTWFINIIYHWKNVFLQYFYVCDIN